MGVGLGPMLEPELYVIQVGKKPVLLHAPDILHWVQGLLGGFFVWDQLLLAVVIGQGMPVC